MKEKIANALKTKYASFGLSKEALDGVASLLEKTVNAEEDIANAIAGENVKVLLSSLQRDYDKLRNEKSLAEKNLEDYKKANPHQQIDSTKDDFAKQLAELAAKQKETEEKLAASEKKNRDDALISRVHEIMKLNGSTNDFIRNITLRGVQVSDGDTAESLAEKYKAEYDKNFKDAYGEGYIPPRGDQHSGEYQAGDYKSIADKLRASGKLPQESN